MTDLKKKIRALLFDIDGTLFSSESIIHETYQDAFRSKAEGKIEPSHVPSLSEIMEQIGKPVKEIFRNLAPDITEDERDEMSAGVLDALVHRIESGQGEHYPDVAVTLQNLHARGFRFFAASNGRLPYIQAILKSNGCLPLFEALPVINNKDISDKTELVAHILKEYKLQPEECLLIGDRTSDRDAALENGCYFAACLFGHGEEAEHKGAHLRLKSLSELIALI